MLRVLELALKTIFFQDQQSLLAMVNFTVSLTWPRGAHIKHYFLICLWGASGRDKHLDGWTPQNSLPSPMWKKSKWISSVVSNSLRPPWTVAYQAHPSMGFFKQEYWSRLPFPSPGDLPNPGIEPGSPVLQADALTSELPGKDNVSGHHLLYWEPAQKKTGQEEGRVHPFFASCLLPVWAETSVFCPWIGTYTTGSPGSLWVENLETPSPMGLSSW